MTFIKCLIHVKLWLKPFKYIKSLNPYQEPY